MARKLLIIVLIVLLLPWAAPIGAAQASDGQEKEIVIRTIHVPHYDIWLRADGVTWTGGRPGEVHTHPELGILPAAIAEKYDLVRDPEVTTEITPELYAQTLSPDLQQRGWWGRPWQGSGEQKGFVEEIYRYRPLNLFRARIPVSWQEINRDRKAAVEFTFELSPYAPRAGQYPPSNSFPEGLSYVYPVDLRRIEERKGQRFEPKVEGWRWMLPVVVTWYLKEKPKPPDFSVSLDKDEYSADPGDKVTVKATFKLKDGHPKPETAKLAAFHVVGGNEYPVELTPVNPADALSGDGIIEFSPGETKTYAFTVTAQDYDTKVAARINPWSVPDDANWEDNRDEALIKIRPQCTDIAVTLTKTPPGDQREGDDAILKATVRRANDGPEGAVTVRVTLTGPGVNKNITVSLGRGERKTYSWGVRDLPSGSKTYKVTVTPVGIEDCAPGNNRDGLTFGVRDVPTITVPDSKIKVELIS